MGYVGLTSALCFASKGFRVVCFDVDAQRAELIASGRAPFYEPRVEELLKEALESELLTVARDPARGGRGLRRDLHNRGDSQQPGREHKPRAGRGGVGSG
jgi:2-polyprenyl-6-methoxyphenol hydroxylase-like FAD-dependent oxidoreductase